MNDSTVNGDPTLMRFRANQQREQSDLPEAGQIAPNGKYRFGHEHHDLLIGPQACRRAAEQLNLDKMDPELEARWRPMEASDAIAL